MNERLFVANMKCSGCAHSIQTKLGEINGVDSVAVDLENDAIDVAFESNDTRKAILTNCMIWVILKLQRKMDYYFN